MSDYERERAVMDSYLVEAQEATMRGFDESVMADLLGSATKRLLERFYRMGFESGWRIHEKHAAGVDLPDGETVSPSGTAGLRTSAQAEGDAP